MKKIMVAVLGVYLMAPYVLAQEDSKTAPAPSNHSNPPVRHSPYTPNHAPNKASQYYSVLYGVESLSVRAVESGTLIRFTYSIVDPAKAAVFNDKKVEAFLDSPSRGVRLIIPTLEKVGLLRQVNTPESGRSYWMAFSNPTRIVKRGDRVNIVIGRVHIDGLVVE